MKSAIHEAVLSWASFKQSKDLKKNDGAKRSRLTGIPKLDDANDAGTKNSQDCTLILTEGDSAKAPSRSLQRSGQCATVGVQYARTPRAVPSPLPSLAVGVLAAFGLIPGTSLFRLTFRVRFDSRDLAFSPHFPREALAISGLSVVGRDRYGVFPLRGKLLNVRDASHDQVREFAPRVRKFALRQRRL
eukprot:1194839-Prorocentrum_minimum.AAC.1